MLFCKMKVLEMISRVFSDPIILRVTLIPSHRIILLLLFCCLFGILIPSVIETGIGK